MDPGPTNTAGKRKPKQEREGQDYAGRPLNVWKEWRNANADGEKLKALIRGPRLSIPADLQKASAKKTG